MRKYKIGINYIYTFYVEGKSVSDATEKYCPAIRNLYYEYNMPLISLVVNPTKSEIKPKTLQEIIDNLKTEFTK